jgi:hypothetical protein
MDEREDLAIYIQMAMAVFGALARILNQKNGAVRSIWHILGDLFVAAFTGLMIFWLSAEVNMSAPLRYAAAGAAGWAGPNALNAVISIVSKKAGLDSAMKDETD